MKSILYIKEVLKNTKRLFGSWKSYYPCKIVFDETIELNALFTKNQIKVAIKRAIKNKEDISPTNYYIKKYL